VFVVQLINKLNQTQIYYTRMRKESYEILLNLSNKCFKPNLNLLY